MIAAGQFGPGPLEFGDRVGHRDPGAWGKYVPGRVVAVDVHQGRPRVRVHPTYRHSPEWEAHPDDLVRVGRNPRPARYGLRRAVEAPYPARVTADGTAHHVPVPASTDGHASHPHRLRSQRLTADGIRWAVPDQDPPHETPRR